jgi:hypothetical protein
MWRLSLPWLVTALASVIVPWLLFLTVIGSTASATLSPAALWSSVLLLAPAGPMQIGH